VVAAAGDPFIDGAATLAAPVFAGTPGFTAAFVIFGAVLAVFSAAPGSIDFALAFVGVTELSEDDATAGSAFGCESAAGFDGF